MYQQGEIPTQCTNTPQAIPKCDVIVEKRKLEEAKIQIDIGTVFLSCMFKGGLKNKEEISKEENLAPFRLIQLYSALDGHEMNTECREHFLSSLLDISEDRLHCWQDNDKLLWIKHQSSMKGISAEDIDAQEIVNSLTANAVYLRHGLL